MITAGDLPRNFRIDNDLKASGSAQFNVLQFSNILKKLKNKQGILINLRRETQFYVDDISLSLYSQDNTANNKLSIQAIKKQEKILFDRLQQEHELMVFRRKKINADCIEWTPENIVFSNIINSQHLACMNDWDYARIYVGDHLEPDESEIDAFVNLIRNLPKDKWIHFYCHAGKGRTTTFLTLLDIIKNARKDDLDSILDRQRQLGNKDLKKTKSNRKSRKQATKDRLDLIAKFYDYVRDTEHGYTSGMVWSKWLKKAY
ncbi:MAG: hypothetical protein ACKOAD_01560 [Gammaproteobacteria bacterium]